MLGNEEIVKKWIRAFAADVPNEIIKNNVTASCNFLWHVFGWGKESYLQGDDARKALDALPPKQKCILFFNGYSVRGKNIIEDVSLIANKLSSLQIDELQEKQDFSKQDIYLVEQNFKWTYVITHESDCGPYFCKEVVITFDDEV